MPLTVSRFCYSAAHNCPEFYDTSEVGDGFVSLRTTNACRLLARGPSMYRRMNSGQRSNGGSPNFQMLAEKQQAAHYGCG